VPRRGQNTPHMDEAYELTPEPAAPPLPGTVVMREDVEGVTGALAADLMLHALNCIRVFGSFHLALSGGSTPLPLYRRLMIDPIYRNFPWTGTHLWVVDERRVPFDDDRCNFRNIQDTIGEHSGIPGEQVHPMHALADDADLAYQRELREHLGWREKGHDRLDFVLLGMGTDGHTASLFPRSPALMADLEPDGHQASLPAHMRPELVRFNNGPTVTPPERLTLTLQMINASRFVAVLVTGEAKRPVLERVSRAYRGAPENPADLPILGVQPLAGELRWYLDHAACPSPVPQKGAT
jgi:6-phosphogluconolactonase